MGQYEVQVADSYGKKSIKDSAMGGIFGTAAPKTNAAKKPGEWQKFLIEFKAPRFENRKRIAPAEFVKVALNGEVIHENVKIEKGPTSGALKNRGIRRGVRLCFRAAWGLLRIETLGYQFPGSDTYSYRKFRSNTHPGAGQQGGRRKNENINSNNQTGPIQSGRSSNFF